MGLELTIWCHIQTPIFGQRPAGRSVYCWLKFHGRVFVDRSQLQFFIGKISGRTHWAKNNSPIRINGSVASGRIIKSQIKPTLKLYCIGQKHKWKPFIRIRTTTIRNKTDPKHSLNVCSEDTPSDLVCRGCTADLFNRTLWTHGPHWLPRWKTTVPNDGGLSNRLWDIWTQLQVPPLRQSGYFNPT